MTPACHLKEAIRKVNNNYWIYNYMFSHEIPHLHHLHLEHPVVSLPLLVGLECSVVSSQSGHIYIKHLSALLWQKKHKELEHLSK